jgi:hypothetical protein
MTTITARIMGKDKKTVLRTISIEYPMPRNYAEACKQWGESVAWGLLEDQAIVRIQAKMREHGKPDKNGKKKTDVEIARDVVASKMTSRDVQRNPVERAKKQIANIFAPNMTAEQHAAIVAMLRDVKPGLVKTAKK